MRSVYLDHAASTPMRADALEAMTSALAETANPSSLHGSGRRARRRLEEARESVAASLGARPSEVLFTSGGTESDNIAVKGIYMARRAADPRRRRVVISAVEHHAVIDAAQWLADEQGAELVILGVDETGFVHPESLRSELGAHADEVALVSVMWANNEVGTVQPIAELASVAAEFDIPFHTDAVQAAGHVPVDFGSAGVSAMSVAAHKFGGPQGVGALLLGRGVACTPLVHGGGHERDTRSGTQNVAAATAMAVALRGCLAELDTAAARTEALRERLTERLLAVPGAVVNGPAGGPRLPGIVHVSFPGCEGDSLLMLLDARGIECSTGSACTAGVASASHVLMAMGRSNAQARGSLRFSLSPATTAEEIDLVGDVIGEVVDRARNAGMATVAAGER
ncbi:cysteine desulfurase family protein [Gordonia jinhuaensis]|uniref:Aminotransferase/cysteine desulfurase n=1 Tax=Gordonia jinhuaensis TaxID=1517702 RepID=A0A916T135_9ACTN|nr:putative aminotransferase/cysteine desulfurase [Gordonia jinhuaensis]